MREVLNAKVRTEIGTNAVKRVRKAGCIPAVLYGHGQANMNLAVPSEAVQMALRHGSKLVDLQGEVTDTALIRDVQWDSLGLHVVHLDLARVSATEMVHVRVPLEIRGRAPASQEGAVVELVVHELEIECPAAQIPDKLGVRVQDLHVGHALKGSDIPLPEGARLLSDPDLIVVHCVVRGVAPEVEEAAPAAEGAEPEVIGRKGTKEEEEEEEA
jgi:large subunit ribosomal protein L25